MAIKYKRPDDVKVTVENNVKKTTLHLNKKGKVVKNTVKK